MRMEGGGAEGYRKSKLYIGEYNNNGTEFDSRGKVEKVAGGGFCIIVLIEHTKNVVIES